jgi:hypothetical protein
MFVCSSDVEVLKNAVEKSPERLEKSPEPLKALSNTTAKVDKPRTSPPPTPLPQRDNARTPIAADALTKLSTLAAPSKQQASDNTKHSGAKRHAHRRGREGDEEPPTTNHKRGRGREESNRERDARTSEEWELDSLEEATLAALGVHYTTT